MIHIKFRPSIVVASIDIAEHIRMYFACGHLAWRSESYYWITYMISCRFLDVLVTMGLLRLVGSVFSSKEELLTYAYMGVNWSLVLPLVFGLGFARPYLWVGQRTAGSWDDLPA